MEYLEGQTLRDRLARGKVPVRDAVQGAEEIAEALAVAHEKGIIHRDLKPANIMLLQTGHAKVMDFAIPSGPAVCGVKTLGGAMSDVAPPCRIPTSDMPVSRSLPQIAVPKALK